MHLHGSITALATPFTAGGEVDFPAFSQLIRSQLQAGTSALVVAGSTGEAAALSGREYEALLLAAVAEVAGRVPVLAGTGLSNTARTIELTRRAAELGADAALVVTPPYVRPTQAGLLAHYRAVADADALPVVLYNVPPRTGVDLLPETVAALAAHPRIVAFKEAVSEPERMQALIESRPEGFSILSGDDPTLLHALRCGADGVISVASNVVPASFARLCALARAGDFDSAAALDQQLGGLYRFLSVEPNPVPVKALLQRMGIGTGLRLPLLPLSQVHHADADAALDALREIEHQSLAASRPGA